MLDRIRKELLAHAPFTAFGAIVGIAIAVIFVVARVPRSVSSTCFWTLHPAHVLLSAFVTTAMVRLHGRGRWIGGFAIGFVGSIGIASLSDCCIPFLGEWLLGLPRKDIHLGFIERPWIVPSLALGGIVGGWFLPRTRLPHSGHVLLSTSASLFHMMMAIDGSIEWTTFACMAVFLFVAVWLPCCLSDIVFPLLFASPEGAARTPRRREDPLRSEGRES